MPDDASLDDGRPEIPDRMFFRIGDVSEIAGVETHVLRFWETEFPTLKPRKTPSGQRQYRRKDVETILTIKELLYGEKYTIAGARKALRSGAGSKVAADSHSEADASAATQGRPVARPALQEIRSKLEQIRDLLAP